MNNTGGLPPLPGRNKTSGRVVLHRSIAKSSSMETITTQQQNQLLGGVANRRDSDDTYVTKQLESQYNNLKPNTQSSPRTLSSRNSSASDVNNQRSGSYGTVKSDIPNYVSDGEDDPYSTPARRRRIIADVAMFLLRQYCAKACKHVAIFRKETAAAIRIQSKIRMYLAITLCDHLSHQRRSKASVVIQCALRKKFATSELDRRRRRHELTKLLMMVPVVQCAWRCCRARRRMKKLRLAAEEHKKLLRLRAAYNIQRVGRGYLGRKFTRVFIAAKQSKRRLKNEACIKIQSLARMCCSIKVVAGLRRRQQAAMKIIKTLWPWCCRINRKKEIRKAKQLANWMKRKLFSIRLQRRIVAKNLALALTLEKLHEEQVTQQGTQEATQQIPAKVEADMQANRQLAVAIRVPMSDKIFKNLLMSSNSGIVQWCLQRSLIRRADAGFHVGLIIEQVVRAAGLYLPEIQFAQDDKVLKDCDNELVLGKGDSDRSISEVKLATEDTVPQFEVDHKDPDIRSYVDGGDSEEKQLEDEANLDDTQEKDDLEQFDSVEAPVDFEDRRLVVTKSTADIQVIVDCRRLAVTNVSSNTEMDDEKGETSVRDPRIPVTSIAIVLFSETSLDPVEGSSISSESRTMLSVTDARSSSEAVALDSSSHLDGDFDQSSSDANNEGKSGSEQATGRRLKGLNHYPASTNEYLPSTTQTNKLQSSLTHFESRPGKVEFEPLIESDAGGGPTLRQRSVLRLQDAAVTFTMHTGTGNSPHGFLSAAMAVVMASSKGAVTISLPASGKIVSTQLENVIEEKDNESFGEQDVLNNPNILIEFGRIQYISIDAEALNEIMEDNAATLIFDKEIDGEGDDVDEAALTEEEQEDIWEAIEDGMILLQALTRGMLVRQTILRWDQAALRIQTCWRRATKLILFRHLSCGIRIEGRKLAIPLQKRWRGIFARSHIAKLRQDRCHDLSTTAYSNLERLLLSTPTSRFQGDPPLPFPNTTTVPLPSSTATGATGRVRGHEQRRQEQVGELYKCTYTWTPPISFTKGRNFPPDMWSFGLLGSLSMRCPPSLCTGTMSSASMAGISPAVLYPMAVTAQAEGIADPNPKLSPTGFSFGDVVIESNTELVENSSSHVKLTEDMVPPFYRNVAAHFNF